MYRKVLLPVVNPEGVSPLMRMASFLMDPDGEIHVHHVITARNMPDIAKGWRDSLHIVIPAHETAAALDIRMVPEVTVAPDVGVEILEKAETMGADAIVMTLDGERKKRRFLGHTSTALLNHSACDVIIVNPLALTSNRVRKVIIPTFTVQPSQKTRLAAESLATKLGNIPIVTLHLRRGRENYPLSGDGHEFRGGAHRRIRMSLKTVLFPTRFFQPNSELPQAIIDEVRKEGYGICLLGDEGRGTGGAYITRSFLEKLFSLAPFPVIVMHG